MLRSRALATMVTEFEFSLLLHLKLAAKPYLISITWCMFVSKPPSETMRSAILMPHLCGITQLMLFFYFSPVFSQAVFLML